MNISEKTIIVGNEKNLSRGHIQHCIDTTRKNTKYTYFGTHVSRGTAEIETKEGKFLIKFNEKNGWAKTIELKPIQG